QTLEWRVGSGRLASIPGGFMKQVEQPPGRTGAGNGVSRRGWLLCALAGGLGAAFGDEDPKREPADSKRDEEVELRAQFQRAGLTGVRTSRTPHFLGIGDAPGDH